MQLRLPEAISKGCVPLGKLNKEESIDYRLISNMMPFDIDGTILAGQFSSDIYTATHLKE